MRIRKLLPFYKDRLLLRFDLWGYSVTVSGYFMMFITLLLWIDRSGLILWGFCAAVFHEMGHLAAMAVLQCEKCAVFLTPFGIRLTRRKEYDIRRELWIHSAGILSNFFAAMGGEGIFLLTQRPFFHAFAMAQAAMGGFNLLPIAPLDGGKLLHNILCLRFSSEAGEKTERRISLFCTVLLILWGVFVLCRTRYNFSILAIGIYLIIFLILQEKD